MTIPFEQGLMAQAEKINAFAGSTYSATDIHKALDCPITNNGIAARVMADHERALRFDITRNSFQIYAADKHGKEDWRYVPVIVIRALICRTVTALVMELPVILNAKLAGVMPDDGDDAHTRKVLAYQDAFGMDAELGVLDILRSSLGAVRASGRVNDLTQAVFDVTGS